MERSVSLHIPQELLESAQRLSSPNETLNDVVILALDREVRRRKGLAAHQKILALNKELPPQPDDTELIRQLREGKMIRILGGIIKIPQIRGF